MERDLHILVNTNDHLVIDSPSDPPNRLTLPVYAFVVIGALWVVWKTWSASRWFALGLLVLLPVIGFFIYSNRSVSYRMDMDRAKGQLVMTTYHGADRTAPLGTYTDPLDAFARADMEYDRDYRRITLSTHDGQQVRPLGPNYEIMNSQFLALGAIQQFLGQAPSPTR